MMTSSIRLSSNRSYVRTNQNACITELSIQSKIYHDYKTGQKFKKKKKLKNDERDKILGILIVRS